MREYPKIETLFHRDKTTFGVTSNLRRAEFGIIPRWIATEKIDGTNIRVTLLPDVNALGVDQLEREVRIRGRTNRAQLNPDLLLTLQSTFPLDRMWEVFHGEDEDGESPYVVTLYGEAYGPRIQKGAGYRDTAGFRLFDVLVGTKWLEWPDVEDVAGSLGIRSVPALAMGLPMEGDEIVEFVRGGFESQVADEDGGPGIKAEGIVARTFPLLYDWRGDRVMWKLKERDFR